MKKVYCKNCKWFIYERCKRFPPQFYTYIWSENNTVWKEGARDIKSEVLAKYPKVDEDDYCGEFKVKK